jgi:hypothetical protein
MSIVRGILNLTHLLPINWRSTGRSKSLCALDFCIVIIRCRYFSITLYKELHFTLIIFSATVPSGADVLRKPMDSCVYVGR